ncbi:MAG: 4Fe-4S dicluster domain-containing protein [bacterium]
MKNYFLSEQDLNNFITKLMDSYPVIAPVAKKSRFVFEELKSPEQLRLDYDTTILPPKKVFFPPQQDLLTFDQDSLEDCIDPREKVLLGVHPYDIKAISFTDQLFSENHYDNNYMANRKSTIIIGSNVQNHYAHAFFGTQAQGVKLQGHDLFMTKIDGGYVVEVLTDKGEKLINLGNFKNAKETQITKAAEVNRQADENCPEKLKYSETEIKEKVRAAFESDIWEELSKRCFSCSSCNIVCPTCYCFDVQDQWNIDQKSGFRFRRWDGCLSIDFSEVSVQGGTENFRETPASRYRHRAMRKLVYLNDKLGSPLCVGCGRCSGACTADIANPVNIVNRVMEVEA